MRGSCLSALTIARRSARAGNATVTTPSFAGGPMVVRPKLASSSRCCCTVDAGSEQDPQAYGGRIDGLRIRQCFIGVGRVGRHEVSPPQRCGCGRDHGGGEGELQPAEPASAGRHRRLRLRVARMDPCHQALELSIRGGGLGVVALQQLVQAAQALELLPAGEARQHLSADQLALLALECAVHVPGQQLQRLLLEVAGCTIVHHGVFSRATASSDTRMSRRR